MSGITVQACGDAHLVNFGLFASPERELVFDLNDFDETLRGPFEWDVARLASSAVVAARSNGFADDVAAARVALMSYRQHILRYASASTLAIWYERIDAGVAAKVFRSVEPAAVKRALARSRAHTSERLLTKLTTKGTDGLPRIVDQPPLITHVDIERWRVELDELYQTYLSSLTADRLTLVSRFRVADFATKVVGVGSVGTLCFVALLLDSTGAPLFLQLKEAQPSVLAIVPGAPTVDHQGARVVVGQRIVQAVSDQFLGWARAGGRDFYVRQLHDMKGSPNIAAFSAPVLHEYLALCGWALARAHARSGEAARIAGYLGTGDAFDRAMGRFAVMYADTNQGDHARLCSAIADGALEAADN
jgi:uncharacterized protein (DUF2252 family)